MAANHLLSPAQLIKATRNNDQIAAASLQHLPLGVHLDGVTDWKCTRALCLLTNERQEKKKEWKIPPDLAKGHLQVNTNGDLEDANSVGDLRHRNQELIMPIPGVQFKALVNWEGLSV